MQLGAYRRLWILAILTLGSVTLYTLMPPAGYGQEVSAGITGRITDSSGAAVLGAQVTARDVNRGTEWPTVANEEGIYAFPRVPPGTYEIKVEASGFRTAVRPNIVLELNQRARIDIQLQIGTISETVTVSGTAPLLQTDTTQVGAVISSNTNVNLPLNGRNFIMLTLLAPGVTTTNPSAWVNGQRTTGGGRPYVNGNRKEANNFLLDGIDNNQVSDNLTAYQPSVDAISEFKMITNNAPAEFGNFQGGIVNVTLKSGTNAFHGVVFEFLRNDKLNANNWARNWQSTPQQPLRRPYLRHNVFGGTLGGPIKKDKWFFFIDYQGTQRAQPGTPGSISVIPAEFRRGDFSRLLTERNIQLYNPFQVDASGNRAAFPNNQIPLSLINPVAQKLFSSPDLYPLPINSDLRFNQLNRSSSYLRTHQADAKVDAKLSKKDDLSVRYAISNQENPGINTFPLFFNSFNNAPFRAGVINWTRSISPTVVNEGRVGVNRITLFNGGEDKGVGNLAEKLGIAGGNDRGPGLLAINFTNGLANSIGSSNIGTQQLFANTTCHYADNLTLIRGRHMMKMGGQFLRQQMNTFYAGNNGRTGFITFNGQYTSGPNPNAAASKGFSEADFFLGVPSRLGRGLNTGTWGHRTNIIGIYFQDDWRTNDTLTLNLGLRWEYHSPLVEVLDRQSNFELLSGKLLLAGKDGNSRALYNPFKKDFQPRFGFAWAPKALGGRTVVRGAYTISSFMEGTGTNLRLPLNPPFNTEFEAIYEGQAAAGSRLDQGLTILKAANPYKGVNIRLWDPNVRPSNVQQWSFLIEQQFAGEQVLSVGYVGQHGTHLVVPMPYFQKRLLGVNPDGSPKTEASPFLAGNPDLKNIAQISGTASGANQRYDSLQANLRRRFNKGFEYILSYTFSKGMSDAIGYYGEGGQSANQSAYWQNLYDQKAEWGPTYFDAKHIFTYSAIYDLPIGRNKRWGSNWNPVANQILGNWQFSGILFLRSGFPLTIQDTDRSGTISRGPRANRIRDGAGTEQVGPGQKWFDTGAFTTTTAGTFGNSGIGVVRGPGLKELDFSIQKVFLVTEAKRVELRTEFFNLTNTPIFGAPVRNVTSATFGEITSSQGERQVQFALKLYF